MVAVLDAETELVGVVDALCATDASRLADGETLVVLHRQLERLSAVMTRGGGRLRRRAVLGRRRGSLRLGLVGCGTFQRTKNSARRRVLLGRALREMPSVEAAWLGGDIGEAQVSLFGLGPDGGDRFMLRA